MVVNRLITNQVDGASEKAGDYSLPTLTSDKLTGNTF